MDYLATISTALQKKTWEEANKDCTASGSNLVKINSTVNKTDTGFLTRLLDTINFKEVAELSKSDQKTGRL